MTRVPTHIVNPMSTTSFNAVIVRAVTTFDSDPLKSTGNKTSASTVNMSSTTSQPTAMCPVGV